MDERIRELERRWRETGDDQDGIRYYGELARRQPLPCPGCGGLESVADLLRRQLARSGGAAPHPPHAGSVAVGRVEAERPYDAVLGSLGSVETCARCGCVWNRLAASAAVEALEVVREPARQTTVAPHAPGMGDWIEAPTPPVPGAGF